MSGGGNLIRYERYRKAPRTPRSTHARYYYTRSLVLDNTRKRIQDDLRTRCQSAPKVMDSHSRSASPREPIRPQHRPPSPPSPPAAFDNRAYQHDESDPNHNDSFTSNGPQQNGHTKEPNGETKTLEAVNLELINLTPKNGNAKKKDVEVDMNASNPYDEYFVPVNEHRKYMRGEKLYVTADKRGEKGGCKRPLCWTLLGLVVAAVVAVIVLAATGILFTNSPTTLEQYNTSISSARALGGIGHDHHDHEHHHHDHPEHDHTMPTQPEHGPETQNDEAHEHEITSDENDSSLYVPRTVEGELKIDNEEFTPMLKDSDSNEYKEFVSTFTEGLKRALFDRNTLDYGDNDIFIEVVQLSEGSVIVTYRIHWKPRIKDQPSDDLLTPKNLEMKLQNYLNTNDRMISSYHVAEDKMIARPVLDICQINQYDCDHGCEFNERTLDFTCTCPPGLMLDMTNPKKCMSILEGPVEQQPHEEAEKVNEAPDSNPTTMKSMPEDEKAATEPPHVHEHENTFDWKETHHMMPVTTTESEADVNFSHIFGHEKNEHETESYIETHNIEEHNTVKSGQETEPKPEPEPTSEPQSVEEPQPFPEPQPAPEPEPTAEPKPTAEPEPAPKQEPAVEPIPPTETEPTPEPEPVPEPEPTAEPEPTSEPHPTAEPQPAEEPKIIPEILPTHDPRPAEETYSVETHATEEPQPASEPQPESEIQNEAQTDAKTNSEPNTEPESTSEPYVEPDLEKNEELEHSVYMFKPEIEPTAEPQSNAEHEPQPNAEPESKSNSEPEPQPNAEPEPQPNAEPEPQIETEIQTENESEMHTTAKPQAIETHTIPEVLVHVTEHEENTGDNTGRALDQENNITSEEKPTNIDENVESKMLTTTSSIETTTMRMSISEPKIINEPSYEPKPEIISIFNDNKDLGNGPVFVTSETNESTTKTNDWLENNTQGNMKNGVGEIEAEKSTESNFPSNLDAIMKYLTPDHGDESESRSFKNIDSEVVSETTTVASSSTSQERVPIDLITKENEVPVTESIGKVEEETTKPFVSIFPDINMREPEKDTKEENDPETTTTSANFIHEHNDLTTIASNHKFEEPAESATQKQEDTLENESNVTSSIEEIKLLDSRNVGLIETTTRESETVTEYSIVQYHHGSEEDKQLMDALENKKHAGSNETSTESNVVPDEGMDMITFDAINQLNGRSSKSIETLNKTNSDAPEANDILSDVAITTTESDWLSESVTETNYEEAMNKMEKHETTETTIAKMDDIINHELTKDDFEPDYLNNMGPGSKGTEQEEPAYGMVHDYDNEDSRVKRVHTEVTTESNVNELSGNMTQEITETSRATNVPIETTTVSEYIYKSTERTINQPEEDTIKQNSNDSIMSVISHSPVTVVPAPVWEESEVDKELAVKELARKENDDITTKRTVMIDEIIVPTTVMAPMPTTTSLETTTLNLVGTTITENKIVNDRGNEFDTLETRNATQISNLNVTIYEISNHNSNSTIASPKSTNANSAEYEDHETDMNPFLPEVENNKSLVKKLQEGHDIESMINETQNENVEEHFVPSEGNSSSGDNLAVISKGNEEPSITTTLSSTEGDTSFNELLMHINSHENATEPPRTNAPEITTKSLEFTSNDENNMMAKSHEKEILPVSSFLMDTDDLDTYKPIATKIQSEGNTFRPVGPASVNSDSEFLSVVPIEEERKEEEALKGNYKKDNIQELNAISDSPKKSDRRTLDETKFDAVINNEA